MEEFDEIDFESDTFADIVESDDRYDPRAYAFLMNVVNYLSKELGGHASAEDILEEFRLSAIDQYGPLAYTVLTEWGVCLTEDIGNMMANLVEFKRIERDEGDSFESFADGYDFKVTFFDPYQP